MAGKGGKGPQELGGKEKKLEKWQEFPAMEATRRMNSLNTPGFAVEGLASSQIAFAATMADIMKTKDGPDGEPEPRFEAPAAFDKEMLARFIQQGNMPQEEEKEEEPAPAPAFQLPPGFELVEFDNEEEAQQAVEEMAGEEDISRVLCGCGAIFIEEADFCHRCGSRRPNKASEPASAPSLEPPRAQGSSSSGTSPPAFAKSASASVPAASDQGEGAGGALPAAGGEKTKQVKSIVDNVLGALKANAASSAASAAVQPPVAKVQPVSRPASAREIELPASANIFVPSTSSETPLARAQAAVGREDREREETNRQEEASWAEIRDRRNKDRRSRSRRRSRSGRARRSSPQRRAAPRKRSRSASPPPTKPRRSGFTSGPAVAADANGAAGSSKGFSDKSSAVQLGAAAVPDWLSDLAQPAIPRALLGRKVLRMPDAYIKCLIGRGGETIRHITNKTGADIKIEAKSDNLDGIVSIANNIEATEKMIKEILASKGCHWESQETQDLAGTLTNVGWKGHVDQNDLKIPTELVGLFIGNAGQGIKDIKKQVGGAVTIKVLPPLLPGGLQCIQVVGEHWQVAKEIVRAKIKEILQTTPGRWHAPGFLVNGLPVGLPNNGGAPGSSAHAGYMPGFGATPGMSISKEPQREGKTMNIVLPSMGISI